MSYRVGSMRARAMGLALSVMVASSAFAQQSPPATAPADSNEQKDLALAMPGSYKLDPNHVAVIARVMHRTFSFSVFRFGVVQGMLNWNPAAISGSELTATVQTDSIQTNVKDFATQLIKFLKSAKYPQATFVSTAFRQTDPTHEFVDGQFTLMGKSEPITFAVSLVGAGPGFTPGGVM